MTEQNGPVLVTGANGHLGRRLLRRLVGERELVAVVRSERARAQIEALALTPAPRIAVLEYGDAAALGTAARGCSHAAHLVGILKEGSNSSYTAAHEDSAAALAEAADAAGLARVVLLSILGSRPASSNACLASKGRSETILRDARTPLLVLRVPMVLGEGDFASRALAGQAGAPFAALVRGGASLEQPIYAGDVVDAIVAGITREGLDAVALDLAGPESLSRRALLARAVAVVDGTMPKILPVPFFFNRAAAWLFERLLSDPPLTRAMLGVLDHDDSVDVRPACTRLGIELTTLDETLRRCIPRESSQ
ncbi:MAG: NAD(P)H-binding protein [Deltaproteobacteria bacterium]|nr:NAD(P)H-binding protein [Deltaproteobacteria bacterium]MBW2359939.1 NAD(P)H-binding protein [Deltaproteobacteria bacterium]